MTSLKQGRAPRLGTCSLTEKQFNKDWIPAELAVRQLELAAGGKKAAKELLADLIRDNDLLVAGERVVFAPIDEDPHGEPELDHKWFIVPYLEFWRSLNFAKDVGRWAWKGRFVITRGRKPRRETTIFEPRFQRTAIADLVTRELRASPKGAGGRPTNEEKWLALGIALIKATKLKHFEHGRHPSAAKLRQAVVAIMGGNEDDKSFEKIFVRFFDEFVRPDITQIRVPDYSDELQAFEK